jgi:glycosyltransferase involved in cell wall biosynthesis
MLSVVIATQGEEHALVRTLAALVPGAVAGIVHEVILADDGSSVEPAHIAEAAGCRIHTTNGGRGARLKSAAAVARAEWLLFLRPGYLPDHDWIDHTRRFIEETVLRPGAHSDAAIIGARATSFRATFSDAWALLRAVLSSRSDAGPAILIAKSHYRAVGGHRDVAGPERDLTRRIGRRHLHFLRSDTATE